ncbi:hypothetical protein GCM10023193_60930 [Planotetraspora kaengkrachanensis]|uniref:Uncharacterized protein n=1 Tax=Planotetraspora kaengkrachanensis TaxID=575193 RepID=A0A8J3PWU0_9ACTN|nr:hypothetical protein Pka01_56610 [Planotetraspora kaengkrachanensis]
MQLMPYVEVIGRFVEQEQWSLLHQSSGQENPAALATGQLVHGPVKEIGELHRGERRRDGGTLVGPTAVPRREVRGQAECHELTDEQVRRQVLLLADQRDLACSPAGAEAVQPDTVDEDATGRGCADPGEDPQERGLSASVRPDDPDRLPLGDVQLDAPEKDAFPH